MLKFNTKFALLLYVIFPLTCISQVVNGDFENIKPNFLPSNWGMNYFQPVSINTETGEVTTDQVQYTWCIPSLVYASFEPQSGQYAMEISNAFNSSQNHIITGEVSIFNDATQDVPGWNPGVPVGPLDEVSILAFYYKFLPAGNDIAEAKIQVFDADGNEIGTASIEISGTNAAYQLAQTPIQYSSSATPAYIYINFIMAKEGTDPTFGSRLIIDNVVTNLAALAVNTNPTNSVYSIYPTVVEDKLFIDGNGQFEDKLDYKIINLEGKVVSQNSIKENSNTLLSIEVGNLNSGIYLLNVTTSNGQFTKKFVKK
ncbi:T9SS type A sorting domain-containing protein [Flavobacterium sp.]|uniref:T9SS type A sorting domain-containing protein n=1 Tax=Flavobacterium sp. TaxID=239 RepID=UPI0038D22D14